MSHMWKDDLVYKQIQTLLRLNTEVQKMKTHVDGLKICEAEHRGDNVTSIIQLDCDVVVEC